MPVTCPNCGAKLKGKRRKGPTGQCPRCKTQFLLEGEGETDSSRGRRRPRKKSFEKWHRQATRSRRIWKVLGIGFTAFCLASFLIYRVIGPATAELHLEFEYEHPEGIAVSATHDARYDRGWRHERNTWEISIKVNVKNKTGKFVNIGPGDVKVTSRAPSSPPSPPVKRGRTRRSPPWSCPPSSALNT
ncbi:MAG: hypothetical protein ACYTHN_02615 [Planctomycetota bacterium]